MKAIKTVDIVIKKVPPWSHSVIERGASESTYVPEEGGVTGNWL